MFLAQKALTFFSQLTPPPTLTPKQCSRTSKTLICGEGGNNEVKKEVIECMINALAWIVLVTFNLSKMISKCLKQVEVLNTVLIVMG